MGKRSRDKHSSGPKPANASASEGITQTIPAGHSKLTGWRLACARIFIAVFVPLIALTLLEGGLRLAGYGHSTRFFERAADGTNLTTNPRFAWQYYSRETSTSPTPLLIPEVKSSGTLRVVVLGESAAAGTPDPAYSFSRMLEFMLKHRHPERRFEVINCAMRGINSHIILPIALECERLSPDLVIIYAGNNEMIGLHSPSPGEFNFTPYLRLLRLGHAVKSTRVYQLTQSTARRFLPTPKDKRQDMEYLRTQRLAFDDPRRRAVYDNFESNLSDICNGIQRRGTPVILSSVAVNLRDFPPLASLHRPGLSADQLKEWERLCTAAREAEAAGQHEEATGLYGAASRIDPQFAELQFRLARASEAASKLEPARQHYSLARDWDALQFRADSRINSIAERVATNRLAGAAYFVDAAKAFTETPLAENRVPGRRLFHEHVHFTFDGDHQLASTLLPTVVSALKLGASTNALPSREDCARYLAFTPIDEMNVLAAMARQTAQPPFLDQLDHAKRQGEIDQLVRDRLNRTTLKDFEQASAVYREQIAQRPDDWMLRYNFGNLLNQFGRHSEAVAEYESVVRQLPAQRMFRMACGSALLQANRHTEALIHFKAVQEMYPEFGPVRDAIRAAQQRPR